MGAGCRNTYFRSVLSLRTPCPHWWGRGWGWGLANPTGHFRRRVRAVAFSTQWEPPTSIQRRSARKLGLLGPRLCDGFRVCVSAELRAFPGSLIIGKLGRIRASERAALDLLYPPSSGVLETFATVWMTLLGGAGDVRDRVNDPPRGCGDVRERVNDPSRGCGDVRERVEEPPRGCWRRSRTCE